MNIQYSGLSDTYVIDDPERFRVNHRVFVDQGVLALEMKNVFERCWLFIGHESELANKGDFLVRTLGGHNLIFVRGQDSQLRAFYNVCPHRGATVCRENSGTTKLFRCVYHSWAFDTAGRTVSRPEAERYAPGALQDGLFDLKPVAHIDNYRGFYFINYDPRAGGLKSYLGGSAAYLDRIADKSEVGMEVFGGALRYGVASNWKCLAENGYDGYHAPVHATFFDYMMNIGELETSDPLAVGNPLPPQVDLGNGHALIQYRGFWGRPVARALSSWPEEAKKEAAEVRARLTRRFGVEYATLLCEDEFNMLIFPNFAVNDHFSTNIRTLEPDGVGRLRAMSWAIGPKDEPPVLREIRQKNFLSFLGPGGMASPDDAEALIHCQMGYFNLPDGWNDLSRGLKEEKPAGSDELTQRSFWREWNRRMTAT
jgi:p-cumate 2,3-dioxygenase alpha subunit